MSPSSSEATAEQVRVLDVVTPLLGLMLTELMEGSLFSTVTSTVAVSAPP